MPNTNASFSPRMRSDELKEQIGKLERLEHRAPVLPTLDGFDAETEALANLPESAQEPMAKDLPKTALQQRRQVLLGILTEMQDMEAKEVAMLTGEDREDPPSV